MYIYIVFNVSEIASAESSHLQIALTFSFRLLRHCNEHIFLQHSAYLRNGLHWYAILAICLLDITSAVTMNLKHFSNGLVACSATENTTSTDKVDINATSPAVTDANTTDANTTTTANATDVTTTTATNDTDANTTTAVNATDVTTTTAANATDATPTTAINATDATPTTAANATDATTTTEKDASKDESGNSGASASLVAQCCFISIPLALLANF
ncbi:unnamed protein product [Dibothriocephalus latus]|uniref:Uncharacterized protein n=1 Tax=Dibothriocephalus latus TaxID=60516 RepID=A0A3P7LRP5_DIBLA|nr:unnamed protein product [Dibothriocephalus latus]